MNIKVQGYYLKNKKVIKAPLEDFKVYEYDNNSSILIRYALEKGENYVTQGVPSLPQYFRIVNEDFKLEEDLILEIKDIRTSLKLAELEDFENLSIIEQFLTLYPYFRNRQEELVILWLRLKYPNMNRAELSEKLKEVSKDGKSIEQKLLRINRVRFSNARKTIDLIEESRGRSIKERKKLKEKIELWGKRMQEISKYKPEETSFFRANKVTIVFILNLPNRESLFDVFDSLKTSETLPFIHLSYQGKNLFKVFPSITPLDSWFETEPLYDGLHFKLLNTSKILLSEDTDLSILDSFYSDGHWTKENKIELEYNVEEGYNQEEIKEKLLGSLKNIKYEVEQEKQLEVKGALSILDISLNKVIFSDLITNDPLISYFLFINEIKEPVTQLSRYYFYYKAEHNYDMINSMTVLATPQFSKEKRKEQKWVRILIKKASNIQEVASFRFVISRIMRYYQDKYEKIFNYYKQFISPVTLKSYAKETKKISEDLKTGVRLINLAKARPEMFSKGYSTQCQPKNKQPYLIEGKDNCKEYIDKYGKHKIINFPIGSDDYYACQPREPEEIRDFIYPGVSINKRTVTKDDYPYLPCCFKVNQYDKGFGKYLEGYYGKEKAKKYKKSPCKLPKIEFSEKDEERFSKMKKKDLGVVDEKKISIQRVLDAGKHIPQGRYGNLPSYFESMLKKSGYKEITYGTQSFYPILRLGVTESPSSFLHCLERAFNSKYTVGSMEERESFVEERKKDIINLRKTKEKFSIGKQELFDYTDEEIVKFLKDKENYIDPDLFISLASKIYDCNIFLYVLDSSNPEGNIQLPNYSHAYLIPEFSASKRTVFIMKKEKKGLDYPYQCELFVKIGFEPKLVVKTIFEEDKLVKKAIEYLKLANDVSAIVPQNLPGISKVLIKDYPTITSKSLLMKGLDSQIIDENGKTRVLNYSSGAVLLVSPLPPLDLPPVKVENIRNIKISKEKALKFIKDKGLEIISQDPILEGKEKDRIKGLWVLNKEIYYGYIPIQGGSIPEISYETTQVTNPFYIEGRESKLNEMRRNRRIAEFLKQYTLYEYSKNPDNFGKDSYIIDKTHEYDIESLSKRFISPKRNKVIYKEGKIVVHSREIRNKLLYYLSTQLLNDRETVKNYFKRSVIQNYYKTATDFEQNKNQLVFVSIEGIKWWKENEKLSKIINTVSDITRPELQEPYFYRNNNIRRGSIALVQNVDNIDSKSFSRAIIVGKKWARDQVNLGYYPELESVVKNSIEIFTVDGRIDKFVTEGEPQVYLLQYSEGLYAALLFFSK